MRKVFTPILILAMSFSLALFAQNRFDRIATIDAMPEDIGGFGNIVAGVDLDNDGLLEIYLVNSDWHDVIGLDLVPRIYKYEDGPDGWDVVWSTRLPLEFQNTWPALAAGDLDKDGKGEIIWGPVNNFGGGLQPNPDRVVVFESADGSNNMGVDNGDGTWRPNARWTVTANNNVNLRPFRWHVSDIDSDGTDEIVAFCRAGDAIQIYSVDSVPDAADSTETWTVEFSGGTGTFYDGFVYGNTAYGIQDNGNVLSVTWDGSSYVLNAAQPALVGGGSWNSAQVVDIDDDGTAEVLVASWGSSTRHVYLLQESAPGTLTATLLHDLPASAGRLYGGASGDVDGDGLVDFGFGTRSSTPLGSIFRFEYQGGDITDGGNYALQLVDSGISAAQQYDILTMADLNDDGRDEFLYTGTPRGLSQNDPPQPVVVLSVVNPNAPIITDVVDVPNDQGRNVWVVWQGSADDVGGMRFQADLSGANEPTPVVTAAHGKATFTLDDDNNQLHYLLEVFNIVDVTASHIHVGPPGVNGGVTAFLYSGTPGGPVNGALAHGVITVDDLLGTFAGDWEGFRTALMSGGLYVNVHTTANPGGEIRGQMLTVPGTAIPAAPTGYTIEKYVVWRIDAGTLPVQVAEVQAIQAPFYAAVVPTLGDGPDWTATYVVSSHTDNVLQNWKSVPKDGYSMDNLVPTAPANIAAVIQDGKVLLSWDESPDPDFNYFSIRRGDQPGFDPLTAPEIGTTTDAVFLDENVQTGETWYYRVVAFDFNANLGEFSDEVSAIVLGIGDNDNLPTDFALEQNYPNPFNPSTTIEFALPQAVDVSLKIYNIRGQLVKTLVNGVQNAGRYSMTWDGTDNLGNRVASGTYIYAIKAGSFVENKKMILIK